MVEEMRIDRIVLIFFFVIILPSISIAVAENCDQSVKNPCHGEHPDIPTFRSKQHYHTSNLTTDDGIEHCFFLLPENPDILSENKTADCRTKLQDQDCRTKLNMTAARVECAKYGARLPQMISLKLEQHFCRVAAELDSGQRAVLGVKSHETYSVTPDYSDFARTYVDMTWDNGVTMIHAENALFNASSSPKSYRGVDKAPGVIIAHRGPDCSWDNHPDPSSIIARGIRVFCHLASDDLITTTCRQSAKLTTITTTVRSPAISATHVTTDGDGQPTTADGSGGNSGERFCYSKLLYLQIFSIHMLTG